jgi:hypothetical protein
MGGNIGGLQGVIRSIVGRAAGPEPEAGRRRRARIGPADMERVRGRGTFLGGIQPFGGERKRGGGGGLFGGAASTAAQQTFGA